MSVQRSSGSADQSARRVWPAVTVGVCSLALVVVVRFFLPGPALTLEYLKVIVWPIIVGLVLWSLRDLLRDKFAQLLKIGAFGAEAQFAATERLQENVASATAAVLADLDAPEDADGLGGAADQEGLADAPSGDDQPGLVRQGDDATGYAITGDANAIEYAKRNPQYVAAIQRRVRKGQEQRAIEDIMRESAWWGYEMALLGFKSRPTPVVEWTAEGRPIIKYGQGEGLERPGDTRLTNPNLSLDDRRVVARLEDEIRGLETKIGSRSIRPIGPDGERERLSKLKARLHNLDPDSPLGS